MGFITDFIITIVRHSKWFREQLSINDIEFIFINSNLTTAMHFFEPPQLKYSYHILFLTEFIALFDSIDNLNELSLFFSYLDQNKSKINPFLISIIDKFASFKGLILY
jgi:hypothetical protein